MLLDVDTDVRSESGRVVELGAGGNVVAMAVPFRINPR